MPIHKILNCAAVEAIGSPIAYAMLTRLVLYAWRTGAEPLPSSDNFYAGVTVTNFRTWKRWKPLILEAWGEIEPELRRAWIWREHKMARIREFGQKGADTQRNRALANRVAARDQVPSSAPHVAKRPRDEASAAVKPDARFTEA
jgi:hypothetical protein